jgi:hypothetical protein
VDTTSWPYVCLLPSSPIMHLARVLLWWFALDDGFAPCICEGTIGIYQVFFPLFIIIINITIYLFIVLVILFIFLDIRLLLLLILFWCS